jgi:hypothetical protein
LLKVLALVELLLACQMPLLWLCNMNVGLPRIIAQCPALPGTFRFSNSCQVDDMQWAIDQWENAPLAALARCGTLLQLQLQLPLSRCITHAYVLGLQSECVAGTQSGMLQP